MIYLSSITENMFYQLYRSLMNSFSINSVSACAPLPMPPEHLVAHFNAVKPCDQLNFTPRLQLPLCFMYIHGIEPELEVLANIKFLGKKGWFAVWGMLPEAVVEAVDIETTGSPIAAGGPLMFVIPLTATQQPQQR